MRHADGGPPEVDTNSPSFPPRLTTQIAEKTRSALTTLVLGETDRPNSGQVLALLPQGGRRRDLQQRRPRPRGNHAPDPRPSPRNPPRVPIPSPSHARGAGGDLARTRRRDKPSHLHRPRDPSVAPSPGAPRRPAASHDRARRASDDALCLALRLTLIWPEALALPLYEAKAPDQRSVGIRIT